MAFGSKNVVETKETAPQTQDSDKNDASLPENGAETPGEVFVPVNADINLDDLRKQPAGVIVTNPMGEGTFSITPSDSFKLAAKTAPIVLQPVPKPQHVVEIQDFTNLVTHNYNFLVNCLTCGWQARCLNETEAKSYVSGHKSAHS